MNPMLNEISSDGLLTPFPKCVEKSTPLLCLQKLQIPFYDRKRAVSVNDIIRLEGAGNYTNFFLKDGTQMLVSRTLKKYEALLDRQMFVRVHKLCIVNLLFVRTFAVKKAGELELTDGHPIKISRRRAQMFKNTVRHFVKS